MKIPSIKAKNQKLKKTVGINIQDWHILDKEKLKLKIKKIIIFSTL